MESKHRIQKFPYGGTEVEFDLLSSKSKNVMINANEMAKIFGTNPSQYLRLDQTKGFIKACLNNADLHYLGVEKEEDLVVSRQRSGTWMHRVVAIHFAMWLDPAFAVWVILTIEKILYGRYQGYEEQVAQDELDDARLAFLKEKKRIEDPEFLEIEQLEKRKAGRGAKRSQLLRVGQYVLNFNKTDENDGIE